MIAVAATLIGCSREPSRQAITKSCPDEHQLSCSNRMAARLPIESASSFRTGSPTEARLRTERPPLHRTRDRTAHLVTKKATPASITARTQPPANRILPPSPSSSTQLEPKNGVAAAGSGTIGQPTVGLASNSNSRTIQEQVAAAIAVAKKRTVAALATARNVEPVQGRSPNKKESLVAIVMARPEISSVSDLEGKDVAMDEEYSESRNDILVAFVIAGALPDQFSVAPTTAINRLLNREVPAAVLALVSSDSAEGFPDIAGFKVFQIPLLPR
jgi:hypothetical protein